MRSLLLIFVLFSIPAFSQLNADFSIVNIHGCTPFTVQFKDNSVGAPTSWFWDFGDGQTSALQNPVITYTKSGIFSVLLIVKNSTEQDYKERDSLITVSTTPDVNFSVSVDSGCVNLQTSFQDISDVHDGIAKSWLWNFGDNGTSSQQNPTHIYTAENKYDVSLTLTTTADCSATYSIASAVIAGNKPDPGFVATPAEGCASTVREFKNKSGTATAYYWDFGDNSASFGINPSHHYLDTGLFTVKLLVSENGCIDSIIIPDYIHVTGAVARFDPSINCDDRLTVGFRDVSVQETSRLWHFGDGQTSTAKRVSHTYPAPGIYYVQLNVTGTTCNDTAYDTIHIKTTTPKVEILPVSNIYCRNDSLTFIATDLDSVIMKNFAWNSGDGFTTDFIKNLDTLTFVYKKKGQFKPAVYIKDIYGCVDTTRYDTVININGPTANFQSDAEGCTNSQVQFTDASTAGDNAPLQQWQWSYGDGTYASIPGPLAYTYPFPVVYNAHLIITDANGCSDSITRRVKVFSEPVVDAGLDTFACANSTLKLNSTGASSYVWLNNADLSCTNCANPIATPTQSVTYYVTGTNDDGCTALDSVKVAVQTKKFITAQPGSYAICRGDSIALNISGADRYSWSPATTLTNVISRNPVAFPTTKTVYTVIGKDNKNCFSDTASVSVTVNPSPIVNITNSNINILTGSTYTILAAANGAQNFQWLPTTGLSCTTCLEPVATVTKSVTYALKAVNQYGCVDSDHIVINAICKSESVFLPNTFSPNNDGINDYFFPRSPSDVNIKSLTLFNRWGQVIYQKRNFSANNAANGWNGKYRNRLQTSDVYVYVMEFVCGTNKVFLKKGNVTLVR